MDVIKLKSQKGAAAIEFAIVLPLLLLVVFGIIEFGLMIYNKAMITNASREAGRAGIVYVTDPTDGSLARLTEGELGQIVNAYCKEYLITFKASDGPQTDVATVSGSPSSTMPSGDLLSVTVTYHYDYLALPAFITNLVGGSTLTAKTTMRAE